MMRKPIFFRDGKSHRINRHQQPSTDINRHQQPSTDINSHFLSEFLRLLYALVTRGYLGSAPCRMCSRLGPGESDPDSVYLMTWSCLQTTSNNINHRFDMIWIHDKTNISYMCYEISWNLYWAMPESTFDAQPQAWLSWEAQELGWS